MPIFGTVVDRRDVLVRTGAAELDDTYFGPVGSILRAVDAADPEPVSYTHLDVYKRQEQRRVTVRSTAR